MTTNTTPTEAVGAVLFSDYCRSCVQSCGCSRLDVVVEPDAIHWPGPGQSITATYTCPDGHRWRCRWSPTYLPVHPETKG